MDQMDFKDYWDGLAPDAKHKLAERLHTSYHYLSQLANGHRKPSKRTVEMANIVTGLSLFFAGCCED